MGGGWGGESWWQHFVRGLPRDKNAYPNGSAARKSAIKTTLPTPPPTHMVYYSIKSALIITYGFRIASTNLGIPLNPI